MQGKDQLTFIDILFGFRGRIGRLAYVGYNLLAGVALLLIVFASVEMAARQMSLQVIALCFCVPWLVAVWVGAALLAKRLHDLDRSALHAIWLTALWYGWAWLPEPFAAILGLIALILAVYVLAAPGSAGPNRFGYKAGMTAIQFAAAGTRAS